MDIVVTSEKIKMSSNGDKIVREYLWNNISGVLKTERYNERKAEIEYFILLLFGLGRNEYYEINYSEIETYNGGVVPVFNDLASTISGYVKPSIRIVDASGNQITSFGSPSTVADYRSPADFTATYTTPSTFTLSGYNFQLDTGAQIVYIRQRKSNNTSNVYVNGASGYAFVLDSSTGIVTIYKDGVISTVLSSGDMYEVGINSSTKAYDIPTDSIKSFISNYPVQPIFLDLLDTTNVAAGTNYYAASDGIDVSYYNNFSVSGTLVDADGTITMTIEGTNDEDLSTGDWIQLYAYNAKTNALENSWGGLNPNITFALSVGKDYRYNNYRIKVVNDGATNTMRLKGRLTY